MTVACYIRVSSARQKHDSQRAELKRWLEGNSMSSTQVEWYADKDSGTTLLWPEFDRLQRDIFDGRVRTVILWKLDRLSRRLKDGVNILASWCERGVKVVVTTQQI